MASRKYKKSQFDYINDYAKNNYDRLSLIMPKGLKEKIAERAKEKNYKTLSSYIVDLVKSDLDIADDFETVPDAETDNETETEN